MARHIHARLKRCHNRPDCKDEETINNFIKTRYLLILSNQVRFDTTKYGSESIVRESHIHWLPVTTQVQQNVPYLLTLTNLELQDELIHLEEFTEHSNILFKLERLPQRPYEFFPDLIMSTSFELTPNMIMVERDLLTILDVFAALGGFESALMLICGSFLSILQANTLNNFIAQKLFSFSEKNSFFSGMQASLKGKPSRLKQLQDSLPSCVVCCERTKR